MSTRGGGGGGGEEDYKQMPHRLRRRRNSVALRLLLLCGRRYFETLVALGLTTNSKIIFIKWCLQKIRCLIQTSEISKLDSSTMFYKETSLQPVMPRTKWSCFFVFVFPSSFHCVLLSFVQNESCCCFASDSFHVQMNVVFLRWSQLNNMFKACTFWLVEHSGFKRLSKECCGHDVDLCKMFILLIYTTCFIA